MDAAPARLITLAVSHFCEKARWALGRARVPFVEERHMPAFHVLPARRAGGRSSTPVLITADAVYADSTDILAFADRALGGALYGTDARVHEEAVALEDRFDEGLGPHTRRLTYHYVLDDGPRVRQLFADGAPAFERAGAAVMWPLIRRVMRSSMHIDAAGAERSRERIEESFAFVADRLSDGRPYLCGDAFTAADLAFAALAAPVLLPQRYGVRLPPVDTLPPPFAELVKRWRDTPAGRFALRMYDAKRGT